MYVNLCATESFKTCLCQSTGDGIQDTSSHYCINFSLVLNTKGGEMTVLSTYCSTVEKLFDF